MGGSRESLSGGGVHTALTGRCRLGRGQMGRLAVAQMRCGADKGKNLEAARAAVLAGKAGMADMVCLPEAADYLGVKKEEVLGLAEPLDGPLVGKLRALAAERDVWLSVGGLHELSPTGDSLYNAHIMLSNTGDLVATYRKLHLFDAYHLRESDTTAAGSELVIARGTPVGDVGLTTCYDLRFPRLYQSLARSGAHVVLAPSAFLPQTGAAHWETLLRARAIENQVYVAAPAQVGAHGGGRESYGHSMVVGPWGDVLWDAGEVEGAVQTVDIDLKRIEGLRAKMPVAAHRRDDLFGSPPTFEGATWSEGGGVG